MITAHLIGGPRDGLELALSDNVPVPPELRFPEARSAPSGPLTPEDVEKIRVARYRLRVPRTSGRVFYDYVRPEAPK